MNAVRRPRPVREPVPGREAPIRGPRPDPWLVGLGVVLVVALALRLWGLKHGLPIPYNPDELGHYVPRAVGFHDTGDFNPHYFVNPPGLTYLLYGAFAVRYLGSAGVTEAFATQTGDVYLTARVVVALLGTLSVALLYLVGARLFDRRTGLLAAAVLAVSFLSVSWSHQATNDVPASMAVTLSLLGSAGVFRLGRRLDFVLAGAGLGLACAMKYTAGIVILPLLAAAALQHRRGGGRVASGLLLAAAAALATFVLFNPFSVLAPSEFAEYLDDQFLAVSSSDEAEKLGQADENGIVYYLWVLTWGLGWAPLLAAAGGAVWAALRDRGVALFLLPAPVLYILFMGLQERYFGRWLLPILPIVCLLAAYGTGRFLGALGRGRSRLVAAAATAVAVTVLVGQSLVFDIHNDLVLSREGTRNQLHAWMVENVPPQTRIFLDRVLGTQWIRDTELASWGGTRRWRWRPVPLVRMLRAGGLVPPDFRAEDLTGDDATRRLDPRLLDALEQRGVCWVVTGSTAFGRAFAEPEKAPTAIAFYEALARRGDVAFRASPYDPGEGPVPFNFDMVSSYYPLAYHRPGPELIVYRLHGGACEG